MSKTVTDTTTSRSSQMVIKHLARLLSTCSKCILNIFFQRPSNKTGSSLLSEYFLGGMGGVGWGVEIRTI